jgi:hypothetical protein
MTITSLWRIGADIPDRTRSFLLRRFRPVFYNVQCRTLTHAYKVPESFEYPEGQVPASIYGYHRGDGHEALLLRINGEIFRPDGTRYFIALSLAPGVEPARAAEIDSDSITPVMPEIVLDTGVTLKRFPMWDLSAGKKKAA